jgi:hypothetical protein
VIVERLKSFSYPICMPDASSHAAAITSKQAERKAKLIVSMGGSERKNIEPGAL